METINIKYVPTFKRDLKKVSRRHKDVSICLQKFEEQLQSGILEEKLKKHKFFGMLGEDTKCVHLKPDCILIYNDDKGNGVITFIRIGSHADTIGHKRWMKKLNY